MLKRSAAYDNIDRIAPIRDVHGSKREIFMFVQLSCLRDCRRRVVNSGNRPRSRIGDRCRGVAGSASDIKDGLSLPFGRRKHCRIVVARVGARREAAEEARLARAIDALVVATHQHLEERRPSDHDVCGNLRIVERIPLLGNGGAYEVHGSSH